MIKDLVLQTAEPIVTDAIEQEHGRYLLHTFKFLHQNPELSTQEFDTQKFLARELDALGIEYRVMAGTGLCAQLRGTAPVPAGARARTVLLRADIDALAITEQTSLDYISCRPGVMHACGHDAHTTVGLGVLRLLASRLDTFSGTVKLMFQPSEEQSPGGARAMIDEGILNDPPVDAAVGIHTNPYLSAGKFGLKDGYILANSDRFFCSLLGKGGHAAAPHEGIDAIAMAGQFITGLQNIAARQISPFASGVVTIGQINGGYTPNSICDKIDIAGTVRTLDATTQDHIEAAIEKMLAGVTSSWGASYEYRYVRGYPATWNNPGMTDLARQAVTACAGKEAVVDLTNGYMSGDDFGYVAQAVPAVFIEWGTGTPEGENYPWHHPKFAVNTDALKYGVAVAAQTVLNALAIERI